MDFPVVGQVSSIHNFSAQVVTSPVVGAYLTLCAEATNSKIRPARYFRDLLKFSSNEQFSRCHVLEKCA